LSSCLRARSRSSKIPSNAESSPGPASGTHDLVQSPLGHRSQHQPALLFRPNRTSTSIQPVLFSQLCGITTCPLELTTVRKLRMAMILPFSKTIIQRLTTPFPPTPPPIDQLPFCAIMPKRHRTTARRRGTGSIRALAEGTGGHCESHADRRISFWRISPQDHYCYSPRKEVSARSITCLTAYDYATARLVDEAASMLPWSATRWP